MQETKMTSRNSMLQLKMNPNMFNPERTVGPSNQESLLHVINDFIVAVNEMDQTVLVPSRLKDVQAVCTEEEPTSPMPMSPPDTPPSGSSGAESLSPSPRTSTVSFLPASAFSAHNPDDDVDLYKRYNMLQCLKQELLRGPDSDNEVEEDEDSTAAALRFHLQGVYSCLRKLTNNASMVTHTYQSNVGGCTSSASSTSLSTSSRAFNSR